MNHDPRRGARLALAAMLLLCCAAAPPARAGQAAPAAGQLDAWVGEYTFGESGGRTAGGTVIYVVHQLTIERDGQRLRARLESNGYQTFAAFECEARVEGGRLRVFFARHADENALQRGDYERGDHLFDLARSGRGRRARLLTYFDKFRPHFRRARAGGVYFEKQ
jgi:hypothetical protein